MFNIEPISINKENELKMCLIITFLLSFTLSSLSIESLIENLTPLVKNKQEIKKENQKKLTLKLKNYIQDGELQKIKELLLDSPELLHATHTLDCTNLHLAVIYQNFDIVQFFIEQGLNVNALNKNQNTPLTLAIDRELDHIIELIFNKGLHKEKNLEQMLVYYIKQGKRQELDTLLLKHPHLLHTLHAEGNSNLHLAVIYQKFDIALLFIEKGLGTYLLNYHQSTPLEMARNKKLNDFTNLFLNGHPIKLELQDHIKRGNLEKLKQLLLEHPHFLHTTHEDNWSNLHYAIYYEQLDIVKFFIEQGVDINALNHLGTTPLMQAVSQHQSEIVQLLLEKGADTEKVNEKKETALLIALKGPGLFKKNKSSTEDIVKLLLDKHANTYARNNNNDDVFYIIQEHLDFKESQGIRLLIIDKRKHHEPNLSTVLFRIEQCTHEKQYYKRHLEYLSQLFDRNPEVLYCQNESGQTLLHHAIKNKQLDVAEILLQKGAPTDRTNQQGYTALMLSSQQGYTDAVQLLLKYQVPTDTQVPMAYKTALQYALENNHYQCAQLLIDNGANINSQDNPDGINGTILIRMIRNKQIKQAIFLIENGANIHISTKLGNNAFWSLLSLDLPYEISDYSKCLKLLLEKGIIPNRNISPRKTNTPLLYAIQQTKPLLLHLLLEAGADVYEMDEHGKIPITQVSPSFNKEIFEMVLIATYMRHKKSPHPTIKEIIERLHTLVETGHEEMLLETIDKTPFFLEMTDIQEQSLLHIAIQKKQHNIIDTLLDKGISLDKQDYLGITPLMLAVKTGCEQTVSKLIKQGADTSLTDHQGLTVLDYAKQIQNQTENKIYSLITQHDKIMQTKPHAIGKGQRFNQLITLIKQGDLNEITSLIHINDPCLSLKNTHGNTALHIALLEGQYNIAQHLILQGAPINQPNTLRQTPLILAFKTKNINLELIQLLLKKGAKPDTNDIIGQNALFYAIENQHQHLIPILLQHTNMNNNNNSALNKIADEFHTLIINGKQEEIQKKITESPLYLQLKAFDENNYTSPLCRAIKHQQNDIVKLFIENGANLDEITYKKTPLMEAVSVNNLEAIDMLLSAGANIHIKNKSEQNVFYFAILYNKKMAEQLIDQDIDIHTTPHALIYSIEKSWHDISMKLIKKGINIHVTNSSGAPPLYLLVHSFLANTTQPNQQILSCIQELLNQGADPYVVVQNKTLFEVVINSKHTNLIKVFLNHDPDAIHRQCKQKLSFLESYTEKTHLFTEGSHMFQTLAHYDQRPQKKINDFVENIIPRPETTLQMALEIIHIYQPSTEVLLKTICHCNLDKSILLFSFLPTTTTLPKNTLLYKMLDLTTKHPLQNALILPVKDTLFYQTETLPRLMNKFFPKKALTQEEKKQRLNLLTSLFNDSEFHKLFATLQHSSELVGFTKQNYSEEFQNTLFVNFFCALKEEEKVELMDSFLKQNPTYTQYLLENVNQIKQIDSIKYAFFIAQQSSSLWATQLKKEAFKIHSLSTLNKSLSTREEPCYKAFDTYRISDIFDIIETDKKPIIKYWLSTHFDSFKSFFLKNASVLFKLNDRVIHLTPFLTVLTQICLEKKEDLIIEKMIPLLNHTANYQKALILKMILTDTHYKIPLTLYPHFCENHVLDLSSQQKIRESMKTNLEGINKEFLLNPADYQEYIPFLKELLTLCLESTHHTETVKAILDLIPKNHPQTTLIVLLVSQKAPHLLNSQHLEIAIKQHLSQEKSFSKIKDIIDQYLLHLKIDFQFNSMEAKIFFIALQLGEKKHLQTHNLSFHEVCLILAQFALRNPNKTKQIHLFFSKQELQALEQIHQYTNALVNDEKKENRETFETELKQLSLSIEYAQIYKEVIYPWAILLHLKSFQINPFLTFKKPLYETKMSQRKKTLLKKQTPFWEFIAFINTEQPDLHITFLNLFEKIWKEPQSFLFQRLKETAPALFLQLKTDKNLQKKFIQMIQEFKEQSIEDPQIYEPILMQFIETSIDPTIKDLPLELLSFVNSNMPSYYQPFKHFLTSIINTPLFKKIIVNESLFTCKLNLDEYQAAFYNLLTSPLATPSLTYDKDKMIEKLNQLINQCLELKSEENLDELNEDFNDLKNQVYFPTGVLNRMKTKNPSMTKEFKQFLRQNRDSALFKKLCIFNIDIVSALRTEEEQDNLLEHKKDFETEWMLLIKDYFEQNDIDKKKDAFIEKLNQLLNSKIPFLKSEEIEQKYQDHLEKRNRKQVHTGEVFLWYHKKKLPEDRIACSAYQLWKHRLLNEEIPHSSDIIGKETFWYHQLSETLKGIEKIITFEEEEKREEHLDLILNILDPLTKCAAQTQAFFLNAESILNNRPKEFKSIQEAFLDSAMNCRNEVLHLIITELTKKSHNPDVHYQTFVYQVAMTEHWGVNIGPQGVLTEKNDPYGPANQERRLEVIQLFQEKYQVTPLVINHFLRGCIPHSFYTKIPESSKTNQETTKPPYESTVNLSIIETRDTWSKEKNEFILKPEDIILALHKAQVILKDNSPEYLLALQEASKKGIKEDLHEEEEESPLQQPQNEKEQDLPNQSQEKHTDRSPNQTFNEEQKKQQTLIEKEPEHSVQINLHKDPLFKSKLKQKKIYKQNIFTNKTKKYS